MLRSTTLGNMFNKIFLIEDDPSHALLIKRALREEDSEIIHFSSVSEALVGIKNQVELNSVVISDLQLPDSDGISHIGKVVEAAGQAPVIVLTSSTSLKDAIDALRQGAKDFLVKDFNADFHNLLRLALTRLYAASELDKERRALLADLSVLRLAIESSTEGLAVASVDGEVRYCNQGYKHIAELCEGSNHYLYELCGKATIKHESLTESIRESCSTLSGGGGVWTTEFTLTGGDRAFELTLLSIDREGQKTIVAWVRDKTDQKRREKFQRELLSTTTHDLKGPLGAIRVSTELLQGQLEPESKASQLVIRIASAVQNCINLIDEFLSARRIQEGSLRLKPAEHDLVALGQDVAQEFMPIATARKITLKVEPAVPTILLQIDEMGIRRVMGNLISNALKFTPAGGAVTVIFKQEGNDGVFSVVDTGSGMEPTDVQRLFGRFSRLDRHSQVEGSGLGLFVVRSIVHAHGGTIQVTSQVGLGSRFEVKLPAHPPVNVRGELECLEFA